MRKTVSDYVAAITAAQGLITTAANALGVSRMTVYRKAEKHPAIQQAIDDARALNLDKAESKLLEAIDNGEAWAIKFVLATLGKTRGYTERSEIQMITLSKPPKELTDDELAAILLEHDLIDKDDI